MIIQGPLALDWRRRKWGILPRLENGALASANPPTPGRVDLWARQQICVGGRPEWVFVKLYMHGAAEGQKSKVASLHGVMRQMHQYLQERYNDGDEWCLHYVTAREMYNIVRAAEDGCSGNPGDVRDYEISRPALM